MNSGGFVDMGEFIESLSKFKVLMEGELRGIS
jgi:hypothetical protein